MCRMSSYIFFIETWTETREAGKKSKSNCCRELNKSMRAWTREYLRQINERFTSPFTTSNIEITDITDFDADLDTLSNFVKSLKNKKTIKPHDVWPSATLIYEIFRKCDYNKCLPCRSTMKESWKECHEYLSKLFSNYNQLDSTWTFISERTYSDYCSKNYGKIKEEKAYYISLFLLSASHGQWKAFREELLNNDVGAGAYFNSKIYQFQYDGRPDESRDKKIIRDILGEIHASPSNDLQKQAIANQTATDPARLIQPLENSTISQIATKLAQHYSVMMKKKYDVTDYEHTDCPSRRQLLFTNYENVFLSLFSATIAKACTGTLQSTDQIPLEIRNSFMKEVLSDRDWTNYLKKHNICFDISQHSFDSSVNPCNVVSFMESIFISELFIDFICEKEAQ